MKVSITFVIDVNADGWVSEFGLPRSPVAIRRHLKDYLHNLAREHLAELGLLAENGD